MRASAALLAALLAAPVPALGLDVDADCRVELGPGERFEQDRDAVVQPGDRTTKVIALRGRVVIRAGAVVDQAIALGGEVVIEPGARVRESAVSVGGDVRLLGDARVEDDAIAIGGQVRRAPESRVAGDQLSLALQVGGTNLVSSVLGPVLGLGRCRVVDRIEASPEATETL